LAPPRTGLAPASYRDLVARLRHDHSFVLMAPELLDARPHISASRRDQTDKRQHGFLGNTKNSRRDRHATTNSRFLLIPRYKGHLPVIAGSECRVIHSVPIGFPCEFDHRLKARCSLQPWNMLRRRLSHSVPWAARPCISSPSAGSMSSGLTVSHRLTLWVHPRRYTDYSSGDR
jgi:hypothetical protein